MVSARRGRALRHSLWDALGLISRWRRALPALGHDEVVQILDGLALWRVRATTAAMHHVVPESNRFGIRIEAEATPVHYNGSADGDRPVRHLLTWSCGWSPHADSQSGRVGITPLPERRQVE